MADPQPDIRAIFCAALDLGTPAEQAAYLERACQGDPALRARVEALLRANEQASAFLREPSGGSPVATLTHAVAERPGTVIGPYKLLEQIGEGGFGVVFLAEQSQPVRRKVALKVLKPGMDTQQVVARFEAERQALAIMDHPNIAKVYDAGATPSGRPYFVMELVKGVPITEFCDQNQLTPRQRLELFLPVCQAVQHAHHKGIIHRDLKPSNVLVTVRDGTPVIKVIDFGVAKALGQELTDKTLFTGFGQMIGTPLYMSPEQAGQSSLDIDTRSDIYSLGVLVYELLTGTTPFTRERFKQAAYDEIRRIIREEEPPRPSTRLSDSKDSLPSISAQRHTEPAKLTKLVRGELDWIVMKALEKDRNRRYETANGFAADVQRYLNDEPVQACPPSARYRLGKFVRRNKVGLAVAGLVLFFLVLLGSGIGWMVRDQSARQNRVVAQVDLILGEVERLEQEEKWPEALAVARRAEMLTAGEADAATQERVRQALHDLEMVAGLEELRQRESELTAATEGGFDDEGAARRYEKAFRDYGVDVLELPAEESAARLRARPALASALAAALDDWARVRRGVLDPDQAQRLWALAGAVDPDPWRVQVRQASAAMDIAALVKLANAPDTARQPPQSQILLNSSLRRSDRHEEALGLLERACEAYPGDFWIHFVLARLNHDLRPARLEAAVRHLTAARALRPRSVWTWINLGVVLEDLKKLDEAIACFNKAIELDPKFPQGHINLGIALKKQGKLDEAIACFNKAIELDPKFPHGHTNLGVVLADLKKLDEAIACFNKAIELAPKDAKAHSCLGIALSNQGKLDQAIACYNKAIELAPKDARTHTNLGTTLHQQGKLDEAIAHHRKAIDLDGQYATAHSNLGATLNQQGKLDEAIAVLKQAIALDPKHAGAHTNLGTVLYRQKKPDEAIASYRLAIKLDPKNAGAHHNLGIVFNEQGKLDEAIASYRKTIELDPKNAGAHHGLGAALNNHGKLDEAITVFKQAVALAPKDARHYTALGTALAKQGKLDEAITVFKQAVALAPKDARHHTDLGITLAKQGKLDEAITCLSKAIDLNPIDALAHSTLGTVLLLQPDKLDEAITCLNKAIDLNPKDALAHDSLGTALNSQGKLEEAIAAYRKAVALKPDLAAAYGNLGNALNKQGKVDDAIECFKKAIALGLRGARVHNQLGYALYKQGRLEEATVHFRELIHLEPKDPSWYLMLGMTLWKQDKLDEAVSVYKQGIALDSKNAKLYKFLGFALRDKPDEAVTAYKQAIDLDPKDVGLYSYLGGALGKQGKVNEAIASFEKAIELDPKSALAHNAFAWLLATCADPKLRNPTRALALAKKAVQLDPKKGVYWQTLGYAEYRAENWKAAVAAMEKVKELGSPGDGLEWFPLAMAHWQLGNKDEARKWYDRAVQWMDKNQPSSEELRRFRTEAAELLGLKEKKG